MLAAEPAEYFGERACGLALHREPDPCSLGDTRFANGLVFDTVVDPPNDAVAAELEVVNDFGGKKNPLTTVVIGGSCPLPFGEFGDGSKYIWQRKTPLHMGEDPNSVVGDLEGEGIVVLPYTHAGRTSLGVIDRVVEHFCERVGLNFPGVLALAWQCVGKVAPDRILGKTAERQGHIGEGAALRGDRRPDFGEIERLEV